MFFNYDSIRGRQRRVTNGIVMGLVAATAWAAAGLAGAVGLVYVDAINDDDLLTGTFGPNANLAPQSAFSTGFTPDSLWGYRSALGAESPTFSRYIWEAGGTAAGSNVEDAPEITQTLSGLTPNANYDVYVAYWSSGANWGVRAGFTSGNYQLFDRTGTAGAIAGTPAGSAIWNSPPTSSLVPIFTEADRTMYLGKVGTAAANVQGRISVFLNDRPNTTDADRTWLDGLAYVPAGTAITLTATVNRGSGNLSIVNNTGEAIHFTSYTVTSGASALKPASWLSIQDNYVGVGAGKLDTDPWIVTAPTQPYPAFAGTLAESESGFDGATLASSGASFNLGNLWARSPFEDVQVQFTLVGGGTLTLAPQFTGAAIAMGDFNADGNLNVADYLTLREHMHTDLTPLALTRIENYGMGDLTGDSLVNHADFVAFRTSFIQVNGPGAFAAMMAGVPEPSGVVLVGLGPLASILVRRRGRRTVRSMSTNGSPTHVFVEATFPEERATMRRTRSRCIPKLYAGLAAIVGLVLSADARAQLVTGWGLDTTLANATLTEGAAGSFAVTTPTGNAGPRASLASPFAFANAGDVVQLSGTVTLQNAPGNQQFRFGLYNNNGHATGTLAGGAWSGADVTGWLGYMVQIGGGGGNDSVKGRTGAGAGVWLSNTDSYVVGDGPGGAASPPAATPYNFSLTLMRTGATSVQADYSFVGGAVNRSGSFTDAVGASANLASFNAVGFLLNGNTGSGDFSNVTVDVPELLRLRVNTMTGYASIAGDPSATIAMNYYEIGSAASSLTPATWMSLDGAAPASTTSWEKAGGAAATILSETNLLGTLGLGPQSGPAALGKAFSIGGTQDLVFRYGLPDGTLQTGLVEYVSGGPAADFNLDGRVDGADFLVWQRGVGSAFAAADLTAWRNGYGATAAVPAIDAVPEPASTVVALLAIAVCAAAFRRQRGGCVSAQLRQKSH